MTTGFCEADETVGDRFIRFYDERAKGGAGMIIIPFTPVPIGASVEPGLYDDRFIPGVRSLSNALHSQGAKSACQLIITYFAILKGQNPEVVAPSAVMNQLLRLVPRELTRKKSALSSTPTANPPDGPGPVGLMPSRSWSAQGIF